MDGVVTGPPGAGEAEPSVQLTELGRGDREDVGRLIGGEPDRDSRWVGAQIEGCLIGVARWRLEPAGALLLAVRVLPEHRRQGVGAALAGAVEELAAAAEPSGVRIADITVAHGEHAHASGPTSGTAVRRITALPDGSASASWLLRLGYRNSGAVLQRRIPTLVQVPSAAAMQRLGFHLADQLRAGDLVILSGDLGSGKTTLTQGIGAGLGVEEPVTSPTFVLSRIHPGRQGRPDLVHVDAYRLANFAEVDDIDLDHDLDVSVTVVEWGAGVAEQLADDRLEVDIRRSDDPADEQRIVLMRPVGARWDGVSFVPPPEAEA